MRFAVWGGLVFLAGGMGAANSEPCSDGASAGFACSHIEFVGHLSPAELGAPNQEALNDIWGWTDPVGGEEYAIVGMNNGTAFVRIESDGTLTALGRLEASDGHANVAKSGGDERAWKRCHDELCGEENRSAWHDVKVYKNYAYIVSEATNHGVQIFDLTALQGLAENPDHVFAADEAESYYGFYGDVGHAHNIFINEDTGFAYVVGHSSDTLAGGMHILNLNKDPMNPAFAAEADEDGYTHDVQCVEYSGPDSDVAGSELCFASNEDTLTIWDVTDKNNLEIVSRTSYSDTGYTHQGWLSADHRYFYLNDELDEMDTGSRTHLRVFDVRDVDAPKLAADYYAPSLAIDHNNYVHGRWLVQSNYAAGLRILDIDKPRRPVEAAYLDPQPTDSADFYGTWSNFVFPSGLVAFTDINDGLYVVQPTLTTVTPVDLVVATSMDESSAETGDDVSGSVQVSNDGSVDATDVLVTVHLPNKATFSNFTPPSGWNCEDTAQGRVMECRLALFEVDANAEFSFTAGSTEAGDVQLIAMAYALEADSASGDNLDSATVRFDSADVDDDEPPAASGGGGLLWGLGLVLLGGLRRRRVTR